jgi:hypothetical protein
MPRISWLVLGACLLLVGCNPVTGQTAPPPPASITPAPVDSPLPSPSREPSPSEAAVPTYAVVDSVPIPSDSYARVVTNDLRVRSNPGVSDDSKKLEPLLQDGDRLLVLDGPVQASGYDWYQVMPLTRLGSPTQLAPLGWVAVAGKDGEPWIEHEAASCPTDPVDLDEVASLGVDEEVYIEIACFSGLEITFPARLVTPSEWCGLGEWADVEPAWMGTCTTAPNYLVALDSDESLHPAWSPDVDLSFAPDVEAPPEAWPTVEVTGLFDHPAARTCRLSDESTSSPTPDPAMTILECRNQFVVTSLRELEGA